MGIPSYKKILAMAVPIMFGGFIQAIIITTDGIFVSQLNNDILYDAVGNASLIYAVFFMLGKGLADGSQILFAQKDGEGKHKQIGDLLRNAQGLQIVLGLALFLTITLAAPLVVNSITKSAAVAMNMNDFLTYRGWGIVFAGLQLTMMGFYMGLGRTNIIIGSTILLALCNIFLDYALIHGNLGFPKMGIKGAAIASSIAETISFLFLFIYMILNKRYAKYGYRLIWQMNKIYAKTLLKLSYPLMFQGVLSLATWMVFFSMIEHMGTAELESAHNIRNLYFLAFIPVWGFASATKTFVGNLVGQKRYDLIPATQFRIILLSVLFTFVVFHGSVFYPQSLVELIDQNQNMSESVLANSTYILKFISGSILIFAIGVVPFNAVQAMGKTKQSFIIEVISISIYLIACIVFIKVWDWGIRKVWWVEYVYFLCLMTFSSLYLYYLKRKRKHVQ